MLALEEAKNSSEIENIITTHDEMYKAEVFSEYVSSAASKEVRSYTEVLKVDFKHIKFNDLILDLPIQLC